MIDRFGVAIDWRGATVEALTTIALQADHSGCGFLFVPEAWGLEAFSSVGHVLSITRRIRVGTGIVNIFSRSPSTIGMACATLNQIAPGRFLLGLGISGKGLVESFHGLPFERPFKRMEEYIETIKKVQSGEPVDYSGEIMKLERFRLYTVPPKPAVPVYLAALGEKSQAFAGRVSDGAIVTLYPLSKLAECPNIVNHGDPSKKKKVFAFIHVRVTNNEKEDAAAKEEVSKFITFYIASMGKYYAQNLARLGFEKQVEEIRTAASNGTAEGAKVVSEDFIREFSLIGTPAKILEGLVGIPEGITPVFVFNATTTKDGDASARMLREISARMSTQKLRSI